MAMTGATIGKFGLLVKNRETPFLLNQRVAKFHPLEKISDKIWFTYCCINQKSSIDYIGNVAHGSAQPNISADTIMTTPIIKPNNFLINFFDTYVNAYFKKILINNKSNFTLIELRDTLLPKLISGELRVENMEVV